MRRPFHAPTRHDSPSPPYSILVLRLLCPSRPSPLSSCLKPCCRRHADPRHLELSRQQHTRFLALARVHISPDSHLTVYRTIYPLPVRSLSPFALDCYSHSTPSFYTLAFTIECRRAWSPRARCHALQKFPLQSHVTPFSRSDDGESVAYELGRRETGSHDQ